MGGASGVLQDEGRLFEVALKKTAYGHLYARLGISQSLNLDVSVRAAQLSRQVLRRYKLESVWIQNKQKKNLKKMQK